MFETTNQFFIMSDLSEPPKASKKHQNQMKFVTQDSTLWMFQGSPASKNISKKWRAGSVGYQ
jgi:hypothetical protein